MDLALFQQFQCVAAGFRVAEEPAVGLNQHLHFTQSAQDAPTVEEGQVAVDMGDDGNQALLQFDLSFAMQGSFLIAPRHSGPKLWGALSLSIKQHSSPCDRSCISISEMLQDPLFLSLNGGIFYHYIDNDAGG